MDGQPFFVVTCTVDPGMLHVLREDIVPRLERELTAQADAPSADLLRARFTLVFDHEGYSPAFFSEMKNKGIAILSYHKFPEAGWPESEFDLRPVTLVHGEVVHLALAERGTRLSNGLWVREIRQLAKNGMQSSILYTDLTRDLTRVAACMFARWCQENFFKYMRQHYGLDRLTEYGTEPIPETTRVVNPAWRALDSQVRHHNGKLSRELAAFAAASLPIDPQPADVQKWELKKAILRSTIEDRRQTIQTLKASHRHCAFHDLPPEDQFTRLRTEKKHFIDTLKMIAYRAETALAALVRESLARSDDARSLLRQLFQSSVDLLRRPPPRPSKQHAHRSPPPPHFTHSRSRHLQPLPGTFRYSNPLPRHQPTPRFPFYRLTLFPLDQEF